VIAAYLRVSTQEQGASGLGLLAQREAIQSEADRRGWDEVEWFEEVTGNGRPGPARHRAIGQLGKTDVLVVAKLDRLSRSLADFVVLMEEARDAGWKLVALDLGLDLTTPGGEVLANVLAAFAQYERRLIGERTKAALAQAQARGVRLGAKPTVPDEIRSWIAEQREAGLSYGQIAGLLTEAKVPTASGADVWSKSSVLSVVKSVRYRGVRS
jgi:DNA invertase Pin-like site-specific DNA recombinase